VIECFALNTPDTQGRDIQRHGCFRLQSLIEVLCAIPAANRPQTVQLASSIIVLNNPMYILCYKSSDESQNATPHHSILSHSSNNNNTAKYLNNKYP